MFGNRTQPVSEGKQLSDKAGVTSAQNYERINDPHKNTTSLVGGIHTDSYNQRLHHRHYIYVVVTTIYQYYEQQ